MSTVCTAVRADSDGQREGPRRRGMNVVWTFQIRLGTIKRWLRLRQETGRVAARLRQGRQITLTPADATALRQLRTDVPDATLDELVAHWAQQYDVTVSRWTLGWAIIRIGWTRSKRP